MDIFAHGLWAGAAAKAAGGRSATWIRAAWCAVWGMFPDLFAFAPEVLIAFWYRLVGVPVTHHPGRHLFGVDLYIPSHSLVVFGAVFAAVWLIRRRPAWELLGWGLHVLMDIPTHSARFPTPFLWPVSSYRLIGISWRQGWFMALNYSALALAFLLIWGRRAFGR